MCVLLTSFISSVIPEMFDIPFIFFTHIFLPFLPISLSFLSILYLHKLFLPRKTPWLVMTEAGCSFFVQKSGAEDWVFLLGKC